MHICASLRNNKIAAAHDNILALSVLQGADAPKSGLVAMLAAAEIVGNSSLAASFKRRIVFAALAGEPWGYMGSKRLLWELANRENSTEGLALEKFEQVRHLPYYKLEPNTMLHQCPRFIWRHSQTGLTLTYL